ncbi:hypothetical protein [Primorskyibacter sp. 2E233]|uniref:hypothetical protein n=1 Tax=Primorskyibacter sp. 2E233 TaxID=3413431 RepID=UPI003BF048EC
MWHLPVRYAIARGSLFDIVGKSPPIKRKSLPLQPFVSMSRCLTPNQATLAAKLLSEALRHLASLADAGTMGQWETLQGYPKDLYTLLVTLGVIPVEKYDYGYTIYINTADRPTLSRTPDEIDTSTLTWSEFAILLKHLPDLLPGYMESALRQWDIAMKPAKGKEQLFVSLAECGLLERRWTRWYWTEAMRPYLRPTPPPRQPGKPLKSELYDSLPLLLRWRFHLIALYHGNNLEGHKALALATHRHYRNGRWHLEAKYYHIAEEVGSTEWFAFSRKFFPRRR